MASEAARTEMPVSEQPLSHEEQVYAIKTWRYLRLAMVVTVVGLALAVGYERWKVHPGCFQTSISAYYYTPARAVFVGGLITIGACLVCLKGNSASEDVLLNLAGMFAPVVALVPTPHAGSCSSTPGIAGDRNPNIANNVFALLVIGAIGLGIVAGLALRARWQRAPSASVTAQVGYGVAGAVWLAALVAFYADRSDFTQAAHYSAAAALFGCILVVVVLNALGWKRKQGDPSTWNRYAAIAIAMLAGSAGIGVAGIAGWAHWLLALEITLISLFALFWSLQTAELWHDGLR
jgi:hypothetical protein